jgi:hypothetical protein
MSISDTHGNGTRRRRRLLAAGLAMVGSIAAVIALGIGPALAVHDTGAFELDGNATNSATVAGDDWDNVCHQVTGSDCGTSSDTTGATAVDWVSEPNLNATIFTGGGSKDPQDISNWQWKDGAGGLPDKDNLLHSFAARYTTNEGQVLFFGSDRFDNSGDAQQGFWFFQNAIALKGTSGTFTGVHAPGDLLVVSDFSNGGTTSTISVYEWDPTCTSGVNNPGPGDCGATNLRLLKTSTAANCTSAGANDAFCGIVNASTITMPWSFKDKSGTPGNGALNGEFYEGGVNLSTLGLADRCFSSVAAETRSSTSPTATLKDFTLGTFGSCNTKVQTTPKDGDGNAISAGGLSIGTGSVAVTDQATVTVNGTSTWKGSLQFSLCGPLSSATGCATGGAAIGSPISIDNTTTQPISSVKATLTSAGTYCWRADFTSATTGVPSGSDGSTGECFTVNPVTPTLSTQAGTGPVDLGQPITDTATLTGTANRPGSPVINPTTAGAPAGGSITFTAFGPNDCTTVAFTSSTVPVTGDGTYGPVSFTPTQPGTYHWAASYSGDPPNTNPADHNLDCSDTNENVVVNQAQTAISTAQKWLPNDSATISAPSGGDLSGTVRFRLYDNNTCAGTPLYDSNNGPAITVSGASPQTVSSANNNVLTASATVSWLVEYTSNNKAQTDVTSTCNTENSTLTINNG